MSCDENNAHIEKMKLSMFNVIERVEDGILIYNTNSGGILKLNKKYEEKYNALARNEEMDDKELKDALIEGGMIIEETKGNEVEKLLLENKIVRFSGNSIGLTIAPTMACNFRCPYCYEKGKEHVTMNKDTIEKIKEYIRNLKERYKLIDIVWYGGEPLLAFDIIKELMEEVYKNFERKNVSASAITNGYLLSKDIALEMKKLNINDIQVTIDGPPEIHNERRRLPSGADTFFVILNNLKEALEVYPELKVAVRINVDKTNINSIDEIEGHLKEFGLLNKISPYISPVTNNNENCVDGHCFNVQEFALEEINFMKKNLDNGMILINVPDKKVGMCSAVSYNSWVIDAKGDFYKCWEGIGEFSENVGNIFQEKLDINKNLLKWLSYSIEDDEECMKCPYLPVCMGGCPNYRVSNKKKNCHPIKENANQIVRLIYGMSRQKAENNA
ncbi:MAG: radical SAM protein [Bacilli bacterium]|nr:radical SAM protein [Bacilli bacterium]